VSTEQELHTSKPDWTADGFNWIAFGNCSQENINDIEHEWFPLNAVKRAQVQDIWVRHPNRQIQGNIFSYSLAFPI
jgi:hypothetical protein